MPQAVQGRWAGAMSGGRDREFSAGARIFAVERSAMSRHCRLTPSQNVRAPSVGQTRGHEDQCVGPAVSRSERVSAGPRHYTFALQFTLCHHPGPQTRLQLSNVDGELKASRQTRKSLRQTLRVVFLAKARLDAHTHGAHLINEVAVLCHEIQQPISNLFEPFLEWLDPLFEVQVFIQKPRSHVDAGSGRSPRLR